MRTTIDGAGRLVVPKAIRERAGLQPGMSPAIDYRNGRIEIEPDVAKVKLVRRGRFLVAEPAEAAEPLTNELVERTRAILREERSRA